MQTIRNKYCGSVRGSFILPASKKLAHVLVEISLSDPAVYRPDS
jgi:hypothetical protein